MITKFRDWRMTHKIRLCLLSGIEHPLLYLAYDIIFGFLTGFIVFIALCMESPVSRTLVWAAATLCLVLTIFCFIFVISLFRDRHRRLGQLFPQHEHLRTASAETLWQELNSYVQRQARVLSDIEREILEKDRLEAELRLAVAAIRQEVINRKCEIAASLAGIADASSQEDFDAFVKAKEAEIAKLKADCIEKQNQCSKRAAKYTEQPDNQNLAEHIELRKWLLRYCFHQEVEPMK